MQNTNQKVFRIKKIIIIKSSKLYVKWKGYNNSVNNWINKIYIVTQKRESYFPRYNHTKNKINVDIDICNYATKYDLKTAASVDTS